MKDGGESMSSAYIPQNAMLFQIKVQRNDHHSIGHISYPVLWWLSLVFYRPSLVPDSMLDLIIPLKWDYSNGL